MEISWRNELTATAPERERSDRTSEPHEESDSPGSWSGPASSPSETERETPGASATDDLTIVERARHDPLAFAPLYTRYFPAVHGYCLRRLSNPEAAADATAQTFTKALTALPRFRADPSRPGSTFRSWLFAIAHNVVIDARRRQRGHLSLDRETNGPALADSPRLTDEAASPEDLAIASDEGSRLHAMLERLPERQRQIVELRLAGLTGAEIAGALGMSASAVKSAQFRAYAVLRDLLGDPPEQPDTGHSTRMTSHPCTTTENDDATR